MCPTEVDTLPPHKADEETTQRGELFGDSNFTVTPRLVPLVVVAADIGPAASVVLAGKVSAEGIQPVLKKGGWKHTEWKRVADP